MKITINMDEILKIPKILCIHSQTYNNIFGYLRYMYNLFLKFHCVSISTKDIAVRLCFYIYHYD